MSVKNKSALKECRKEVGTNIKLKTVPQLRLQVKVRTLPHIS